MDTDIINNSFTIISQSLSIFTCLTLFTSYFRQSKKTVGLNIIMTLAISDFIMHTTLLLLGFGILGPFTKLTAVLFNSALRFSTFWTLCMSFLLFRALTQEEFYYRDRFMMRSFVQISIFSVGSSLICSLVEGRRFETIIFIFTLVLPLALGIIMTAYYYLRTVSILKKMNLKFEYLESVTNNLYSFAVVQMITILPALIYSTMHFLFGAEDVFIDVVVRVLLGLAGFVNGVVYFFQRKQRSPYTSLRESMISDDRQIDHHFTFTDDSFISSY